VNIETKEQSKQWMHSHLPNRKNVNKRLAARKLMATVFWDRKGVLMVEFVQQGTIMSEVNCKTVRELLWAIQNKRRAVLLHDNARPHTTARTEALLEHFNWELFDHPPYIHDLFLSDHLFTYLKTGWDHRASAIMRSRLKVSKSGWADRRKTFLTYKNVFPDTKCASIPEATTLRSSLSMYVFFLHKINLFFSLLVLLTAHLRILSKWPSYLF
jgi:transposase